MTQRAAQKWRHCVSPSAERASQGFSKNSANVTWRQRRPESALLVRPSKVRHGLASTDWFTNPQQRHICAFPRRFIQTSSLRRRSLSTPLLVLCARIVEFFYTHNSADTSPALFKRPCGMRRSFCWICDAIRKEPRQCCTAGSCWGEGLGHTCRL